MVNLTRIYTKFGDAGQTMLGDGSVVPKTSPRVGAYGAVDEANASIGVAACACESSPHPDAGAIRAILTAVQQDLFDVGADMCTPPGKGEKPGDRLRITPAYAERLERWIDEHNARIKPLSTFVLPGGTPLAASLHAARTVVRRAEREALLFAEREPEAVTRAALVYLNRLSDLLFVLARRANADGVSDVLWTPGANRGS